MNQEHRRTTRRYFGAVSETTNLVSGKILIAPTHNLSPFGVFVRTTTPFLEGMGVRIKISHEGAAMLAYGKIIHSRLDVGMGVRFDVVTADSRAILERWLSEVQEPKISVK